MMLLQSEMVALALELPRLLEFAHAEQVLPILERILDESSSDARPEPAVLRALELLATVARAAQRSANEEQTQRCGRAIFASMLRSAAGCSPAQHVAWSRLVPTVTSVTVRRAEIVSSMPDNWQPILRSPCPAEPWRCWLWPWR